MRFCKIFIPLLIILLPHWLGAQNGMRFSQYMYNEIAFNPAYTGTTDYMLANLTYRNQWLNFEGAPETAGFSFHTQLPKTNMGLGLSFYNEKIGINDDYWMNGTYAYQFQLNNSTFISLGISVGATARSIKWSQVTHNLLENDPALAYQEDKTSFTPNLGTGIHVYSEDFYAGISVPDFFTRALPFSRSLMDNAAINASSINVYFTGGFLFRYSDIFVFKPSVLLKYVKSAPNQLDVNADFYFTNGLNAGLGYHMNDAMVVMFGYDLFKDLRFNYAFDITGSDLKRLNSGTHEFILSYSIPLKSNVILSPRYF